MSRNIRKIPTSLGGLGEFNFIQKYCSSNYSTNQVLVGVGDDTAVLKRDRDEHDLITTDSVVEGQHFSLRRDSGNDIGYKALSRNLSDIAAMGGWPIAAVVSLQAPSSTPLSLVKSVQAGLQCASKRFECPVVGGDLAKGSALSIVVTVLGRVKRGQVALRSGARPGDCIYVTGCVGGSIDGHHKRFTPRLRESKWLVSHFKIRSMIDISDGLLQDLGHVLKASRCGAELEAKQIPIRTNIKNKRNALASALSDGEDYELLFTVPKKDAQSLEKKWKRSKLKTRLTQVGQIIRSTSPEIKFFQNGEPVNISIEGYQHF